MEATATMAATEGRATGTAALVSEDMALDSGDMAAATGVRPEALAEALATITTITAPHTTEEAAWDA
jgi:hypothetical protein